jgi:hypothetical protein
MYQTGVVVSLPSPNRHHHLFAVVREIESLRGLIEKQGFVDEHGKFYGRRDARIHADKCKQHILRHEGGYDGDELFSECLW